MEGLCTSCFACAIPTNPFCGLIASSIVSIWHLKHCPGRILGITSWNPSVFKSNRLHVDIYANFLYQFKINFIGSSKIMGGSSKVLNFNQLLLKLNRFICNYWPVLPAHWHVCQKWGVWLGPWSLLMDAKVSKGAKGHFTHKPRAVTL